MASKKSTIQFVVSGNVESSIQVNSSILDTQPIGGARKSRRRNIALDNDDSDSGMTPKPEKPVTKEAPSSVQKALIEETKSTASKSRKKAEPAQSKAKKVEPAKSDTKSKSKRGSKKKGGRDSESISRDEEMSTSRSKLALGDEDDEEDEMMLEEDDDMLGDEGEIRYDESESGINLGENGDDDDDLESESIYSGMPIIGRKQKIDPSTIDLNKLTRRQRMSLKSQGANIDEAEEELLQLPDKKPRKKKNEFLTKDDEVKKMEQANKRRMHTQKMVEEQKKQIVDRILNEAGRKQRMRKEKEEQDDLKKQNYKYRVLPEGEVGIKYISKKDGNFLVLPPDMPASDLLNNLRLTA